MCDGTSISLHFVGNAGGPLCFMEDEEDALEDDISECPAQVEEPRVANAKKNNADDLRTHSMSSVRPCTVSLLTPTPSNV